MYPMYKIPLVPDEPDETDLTDAPAETDVSAVAGVTGIIMPQDLSKSGSWSWRHGVRRYGVICVDRHSYATRGYKPLTDVKGTFTMPSLKFGNHYVFGIMEARHVY